MNLIPLLHTLSVYSMAALYIFAGVSHFTKEGFFLKIVPPYLPKPRLIVRWSGIVEIVLGLAFLIPQMRMWAAWGIILLLVVVSPTHVYMLQARLQNKKFRSIPVWALWLRLALQLVLIYWAYSFT